MGLYELTVVRGTATANKAVILDSNANVSGLTLTNAILTTPAMGGVPTFSDIAITNAAGSVIANAAAITHFVNIVPNADNSVGVQLPAESGGQPLLVYASGTTGKTLKVYPPVNGTINDGSANAALAVAVQKLQIFFPTNAVNWACNISG